MSDTKYSIVTIKNGQDKVIQRLSYRNGILNGTSEFISPISGNITQTMNFLNGKLDGDINTYDNNGNLTAKLEYKNGEICGKCLFFNDSTLITKSEYKNSLLDGITTLYNQDGSISATIEYKEGKKHGKSSFYQNNKLFRIENYQNNKLHGESIIFSNEDPTKILQVINYDQGLLDGYSKKYYDNGNIKETIKYSHGNKVSCKKFSIEGVEID